MMSHQIARALIEQQLIAWAGTKSLRYQIENLTLQPAAGETFMRLDPMPVSTDSAFLAAKDQELIGIYQVMFSIPAGQATVQVGNWIAELSQGIFRKSARFSHSGVSLEIIRPLSQHVAFADADRILVPADLRYRARVALP